MSSPENTWIKFFTDAGLPSGISATYALTFTDNRIQMNMLLDLNKEYLREMGISCMGDVIAILRHAKQVHEETARDRVLSIAGPKVPVAAVAARPGTPKPVTPATRMLEHYTRNSNPNTSPTPPAAAVNAVKDRLGAMQISGIKRKVINVAESASPNSNPSDEQDDVVASKYLKKTITQKQITRPVSEIQVPEKKVTSVFSRLGNGDDVKIVKNNISSTLNTNTITVSKKVMNSSTVFSRLGDKGDNLRRESAQNLSEPLKYAGILVKEKVVLKRKPLPVKPVKKLGTMRADEEPVNIKDKLPTSLQSKKSVKFSPHVDYKEIEKRPAPVPMVRQSTPIRSVRTVALTTKLPNKIVKKNPGIINKNNIKSRLGKQNFMKNNSKSSVFNRLGLSKA